MARYHSPQDLRFHWIAALVLACGTLLAPSASPAVNLVPNGSFESYVSCPTSFTQIYLAAPWNAPTTGTSDYLNACAPAVFPSVNVPQNEQGYQSAHTGVGYAGIIPFSAAADYREYIEAPLTSPLVANASYLVQFYVSLADSSILAIDRLGAYLSVGPVGPIGNDAPLAVTPQVESPASLHLTNSTGWTLVSGTVVASGGEDHIVIGSFHDDASTSTVAGPGLWPGGAYYYIDDVRVELALPTEQACCMSDNSCSMQFPGECTLLGGTPMGAGTTCTADPCLPTQTQPKTWGAVKAIYR
jgi:OOP family OmpA-OmpF porin